MEDFLDLDWPSFKTWAQAHRLIDVDREEKRYNPFRGTEVHGDRPEAREIIRDPRMILRTWAKSPDGLARLRAATAQLGEQGERTCCRLLQEDGGQDCHLLLKAFLERRTSELLATLRSRRRFAIIDLVVIASAVAVGMITASTPKEFGDRIVGWSALIVVLAVPILLLVAVVAYEEWKKLRYCRRLLGQLKKDS